MILVRITFSSSALMSWQAVREFGLQANLWRVPTHDGRLLSKNSWVAFAKGYSLSQPLGTLMLDVTLSRLLTAIALKLLLAPSLGMILISRLLLDSPLVVTVRLIRSDMTDPVID